MPQTFVGDVNGDGCSDMIVQWRNAADKRNLLVYQANTNTTYNAGVNFESIRRQQPILFPACFLIADVNNDGRDDFIVKWKNGNTVSFLTYLGTASATFSEGILTTPSNAIPFFNYG